MIFLCILYCKYEHYSTVTPRSCDLLVQNQCRTVDLSLLYDTHISLLHLNTFSIFYEFLMYTVNMSIIA